MDMLGVHKIQGLLALNDSNSHHTAEFGEHLSLTFDFDAQNDKYM
jgi:hypothetical protein